MNRAVTPEINAHLSPWGPASATTPPQPAPGVLPFEPPAHLVNKLTARVQSRRQRLAASVLGAGLEPPAQQEPTAPATTITAQQVIAAGKRGALLCKACGQRTGRVFRLRGSLQSVNVVCRVSVGGCGRIVTVPFA